MNLYELQGFQKVFTAVHRSVLVISQAKMEFGPLQFQSNSF